MIRTVVETLKDMKDSNLTMFGHCMALGSGHGRVLNIDRLISAFGEDHVFINDDKIPSSFVCTHCGHVGGKITLYSKDRTA